MTWLDWSLLGARALIVVGCVGIHRALMPVIRVNMIVHYITGYFPKEDEEARALFRHLRRKQIERRLSPGD